jgi:hypothetical protein
MRHGKMDGMSADDPSSKIPEADLAAMFPPKAPRAFSAAGFKQKRGGPVCFVCCKRPPTARWGRARVCKTCLEGLDGSGSQDKKER